jgi:membrane protease YdiL (CAAX protease family)
LSKTTPLNLAHRNESPQRRAALTIALVIGLVFPSLVTWVYFDLLHGSAPAVQQLAYTVGKTLQFALPLFVAWRGWGGTWERPGPRGSGQLLGCLFGLAVCGLIVLAFAWLVSGDAVEQQLLTAAQGKLSSLGLVSPSAFILLGVFYSICHSLLEEYYWRWFVFGRGRQVWGIAGALVFSSLGFMAHHILLLGYFLGFAEWRTYVFAAAIAVGGAFWAWLYHRTDNLTASWLSHALVDAGIFGLGYWLLFA